VHSLRGGDAGQNAAALDSIFRGEPGPRGDAVAINGGAALYIAGLAPDLKSGTAQAQTLLRTGEVIAKLESLREVCRRVHPPKSE
jgi:anthranilate phosphoribosyltransferase